MSWKLDLNDDETGKCFEFEGKKYKVENHKATEMKNKEFNLKKGLERMKRISRMPKNNMKEEFNLSDKIFWNDKSCAINRKSTQRVLARDVKEFIRQCEDNSEAINGTSYIKISEMQKFAGKKLIGGEK